MADSTRRSSSPPNKGVTLVVFFAPIGVSALVILGVSLAVLSHEPEEIERRTALSVDTAPVVETPQSPVSSREPAPQHQPMARASEAPPKKRLGFSPVLARTEGENEGPSASNEESAPSSEEPDLAMMRREEAKAALRARIEGGKGFAGKVVARSRQLQDEEAAVVNQPVQQGPGAGGASQ